MLETSSIFLAASPSINNRILQALTSLRIESYKYVVNTREGILYEIERQVPRLVFLSHSLPGAVDLLRAIEKIKQLSQDTKIILVTSESDSYQVETYITANVDGIISMENINEYFEFAIKQIVVKGELFVCGKTLQKLREGLKEEKIEVKRNFEMLDLLTDREVEILYALTQGVNYKEISKLLFISESTVKTHVNNIFTKLNVNDRTQAVLYALKHGIEGVINNPNTIDNVLSKVAK